MKKQKTRDRAMLTNNVEGLMSISFPSLRCFYKRIISRHHMHEMQHGYLKFAIFTIRTFVVQAKEIFYFYQHN